ncbi:hypothetical protein HJFPF1_12087 [Paramyrothecium foliicola]|nr:hypothetical protein HJFPF1_12087 [Paramyrothecium foliicola]
MPGVSLAKVIGLHRDDQQRFRTINDREEPNDPKQLTLSVVLVPPTNIGVVITRIHTELLTSFDA